MSKKLRLLFGVFISLGVILAFLSVTLVQAGHESQVEEPESGERVRSVSVTGSGEIRAIPDLAIIRLGVENQAETAEATLDENNERMQALINALQDSGIPAESIQTQTIRLAPRYRFDEENGSQTLIGYSASNSVDIESDDLQRLGIILDQAVRAGATTIDSIRFELSNAEDLAADARQAAVANAKEKAEQLAELTGVSLGAVLDIQEFSNLPSPVQEQVEFQAEAAAIPIQPGKQTIRINVQITWQLEQ